MSISLYLPIGLRPHRELRKSLGKWGCADESRSKTALTNPTPFVVVGNMFNPEE
jgi:hypothetical protein